MKKKSLKKSKTALVAVKKEPSVQDLVNMFAGSSSLVQNDKFQERNLIIRVAEAFAIPATCVNIMGGLPYINKDGLLFKLDEYDGNQIVSLTTKIVQYAVKGGDRAIAEAILIFKDGRNFNAIGEADEKSIKLSAVKQTPNMMAETRAQNRVIRRAIQAKMLRDLYTKLGGQSYSETEKKVIENSINSSAEEMSHVEGQSKRQEIIGEEIKPAPVQIKKDDLLKLSLDKIQKETDPALLAEYRNRIEQASVYSENQKKMLYGAIAGQLKKNAKK